MNYLGHAVFSPQNDGVTLGNLAGDFLKNKLHASLDSEVLQGVHLHRFLDSTTDENPYFRDFLPPLRKHFGRYSPVVMDVLLDHILIKNWNRLFQTSFEQYTQSVCLGVLRESVRLPHPAGKSMHSMASSNWLHSCKSEAGLLRVFNRLSQKASVELKGEVALGIYNSQSKYFEKLLADFMFYNKEKAEEAGYLITPRIEWRN